MYMASRNSFVLLFCSIITLTPSVTAAPNQFQSWFPQFGRTLQSTLQQNCSAQYEAYTIGNYTSAAAFAPSNDVGQVHDVPRPVALTDAVVDCLLEHLSENSKANMAVAGVLLGLMPTIFSALGSNTAEMALLTLVARRPLLAFLLATGSPAVAPLRPFQYPNPHDLLHPQYQGAAGYEFPTHGRIGRTVIAVIEYALAAAAIVNVYTMSYSLGTGAIFSIGVDQIFFALFWVVLFIPVYVLGCISFGLLVRICHSDVEGNSYRQCVRFWLKDEFTPSAHHEIPSITRVETTARFLFVSWLTEIGVVLHVFFATVVFSSILFLGNSDALSVGGRYMASVVVCRAVVSYEIAGLRKASTLHRIASPSKARSGKV